MSEAAAIIFMGCCLFLPMILAMPITPRVQTVEVIKYIEKPVYRDVVVETKKQENKLANDAIQCLISLGMKKADAKKKVEEMFSQKDYQSIESFLLDVYKK